MTIPTFTPGKSPVIGNQVDTNYRTLDANFGDGYSQATIDGLNAAIDSYTISWSALTLAQKNTIKSQLDGYNGTSFQYQMPWDSSPKVYRCKKVTVSDANGISFTLSATFTQAFDLT